MESNHRPLGHEPNALPLRHSAVSAIGFIPTALSLFELTALMGCVLPYRPCSNHMGQRSYQAATAVEVASTTVAAGKV